MDNKKIALIGLLVLFSFAMAKSPPPTIRETMGAIVIVGSILQGLPWLFQKPVARSYRLAAVFVAALLGIAAYVLPRL